MQLQDKTAFVTGAASGLGLAAARRLSEEGANVLMFDRDEARVQQAADLLGERVLWAAGDISDEEAVSQAIEQAVSRFGGIHINLNCAGIGNAGKTVGRDGAMALDAFSRVIQVNLIGTFNVLRLCADQMCQNGDGEADGERGVIINVASIAAWDGQMGQAAYSASKGGIVSMTLPIARDLARQGVRVMTVAPGIFETPLMSSLPDAVKDALTSIIEFPSRMGVPEEFADMAMHIIRNRYLNGESIRLDAAIRMPAR